MAPKRKDRTKHVALTPQDVSKAAERIQKLRITCDPAEITAGLKELITVSNACSGTRGGLTRADLESWAGIHLRFLTCMFDYSTNGRDPWRQRRQRNHQLSRVTHPELTYYR
eukprot:GEMP01052462.1.p1 GENE.GEMP01052462.1~~GEMP01052462.1.p1  ORF type:complete len:112 (+),score=13.14 GEMP01052462.1:49-384(+)